MSNGVHIIRDDRQRFEDGGQVLIYLLRGTTTDDASHPLFGLKKSYIVRIYGSGLKNILK